MATGRMKAYWDGALIGTECVAYDVEHERANPVTPAPVVRSNTPALVTVAPNIVYRIVVKVYHTTADAHLMAAWRIAEATKYTASGILTIKNWADITKLTATTASLESLTTERAASESKARYNPNLVYSFITTTAPTT